MGEYRAPGVYVEEVPSAVKSIAGVSTSTAGFVGRVAESVKMLLKPGSTTDRYPLAPAGEARLVTNWEQWKNTFGDFTFTEADGTTTVNDNNTLAHAVYGFFNNGGTRCWVVRIADALSANNVEAALGRLEAIDEIALVAVPGATTQAIQEKILSHCESEHLQDRFAILDGVQTVTTVDVNDISGSLRRSSYGAFYYPWIQVADPASRTTIAVPPSGHIAGVYARTDATRGVHKAPANAVMRGALDVQRLVSREEQAGVNLRGINIIRKFDGNITIWGARTWADPSQQSEWVYVNVRRLFLYLRKSIDQGTQWVVFEPNEMGLWAKITRNITAFLTNVWRAGALFGTTPQEAFYVKCDGETNPPEVRAQGQVVTEIGVALVKPAEFVIFRLSQWAGPGR